MHLGYRNVAGASVIVSSMHNWNAMCDIDGAPGRIDR